MCSWCNTGDPGHVRLQNGIQTNNWCNFYGEALLDSYRVSKKRQLYQIWRSKCCWTFKGYIDTLKRWVIDNLSFFCCSYYLTLVRAPESDATASLEQEIEKFVLNRVPGSVLMESVGQEMLFQLPSEGLYWAETKWFFETIRFWYTIHKPKISVPAPQQQVSIFFNGWCKP